MPIVRVIAISRRTVTFSNGISEFELPRKKSLKEDIDAECAVGDWAILDEDGEKVQSLLARSSLLMRSVRNRVGPQLIAANVDICFIVTSCDDDFNESRLERYLIVANKAGVHPHIVLTKIDLYDNPRDYGERAATLMDDIGISYVNALDTSTLGVIAAQLKPNFTGIFVGSSGVGKSTIINSLLGYSVQATSAVRSSDQRGRHTTTGRSLHVLPSGGCVIDVPGMKLVFASGADSAVEATFSDVESLASKCRFSDCKHQNEPDCAVRQAIADGLVSPRRVENYLHILRQGVSREHLYEAVKNRDARLKRQRRLARDKEADED